MQAWALPFLCHLSGSEFKKNSLSRKAGRGKPLKPAGDPAELFDGNPPGSGGK
jgi:hypothetical protein